MDQKHQLEYREALNWWRTISQMRRRDITLFTGGQGAVLIYIGSDLASLNLAQWFLGGLAIMLAVVGRHNDIRLTEYMNTFRRRAGKIEKDNSMYLVRVSLWKVSKLPRSKPSGEVFMLYYSVIIAGWAFIFGVNAFCAFVGSGPLCPCP